MATTYLAPIANFPSFLDNNGALLSGGKLHTYLAGTTENEATFKDNAGATAHANPIILDSRGEVVSPVWLSAGIAYKLELKDSEDVSIWIIDDVIGIGDPTDLVNTEFLPGPAPTQTDGTTFTMVGDQTSIFHVNRRLETTDGGGIKYSYVESSIFSVPLNKTTVIVGMDSGTLAADLSIVKFALLAADNFSVPNPLGHAKFLVPNALINGVFDVWQRGTSFTAATTPANSDDTYLVDRWLLLSDGNDRADITQETAIIPTGGLYSVKFDVETVGSPSEKFGILQIIENKNALKLAGKTVSLSFQARTTGLAVENLRALVLAWDSTADAVTSDVVSAWGVEGVNPTLVANWTEENTPANLALSNVFQTFKIEGISIDTVGMTNLAVFIWVDDTDLIAGDVFYVAKVKLEEGAKATEFGYVDHDTELHKCYRYFERINQETTASVRYSVGLNISTIRAQHQMPFYKKRDVPTFSVSDGGDFALHEGANITGAVTGVAALNPGTDTTGVDCTGATSLDIGQVSVLLDDGGGSSFIDLDSEL